MSYTEDILNASLVELPWGSLSGKNILITGATGLIGSTLVEILMARPNIDFEVFAAGRNIARAHSRFSRFLSNPHFHFVQYDVCNVLPLDINFHFIISAASGSSPKLYATKPVEIMQTIFMGTDHLLSYGCSHGLEKFVFVSSGDSYGEGNNSPIDEYYCGFLDPLTIRSCYGMAKRTAETLCVSYAAQYGTDVVIVRPCHTYGPYFTESDDRASAQFFRNATKSEAIVLKSEGKQLRSWCYVVDVATGILFSLFKGKTAEAYNIADPGSVMTIREYAETLARLANVPVVLDQPSEVERKGYSVITNSVFDTGKLMKLGWSIHGSYQDKLDSTLTELKRINEKN